MENVNLPNGTAQEPDEEAHEPQCGDMSPPSEPALKETPKKRKIFNISFAETAQSSQKSSQSSSIYKEALSQPPPTLTHRQRLQWLQQRRTEGLWAQCDSCGRWRYMPHVLDSHELPAKWYCSMNPDKQYSNCSVPEAPLRIKEEEDLIHGEYSAGSVVWARLPGWPWWPAMVDDCPDTEQFYWLDGFSDIPTHYNVVFFDAFDCTRAWIAPEHLLPYEVNKKMFRQKDKKYKKRLETAQKQADDADALPVRNRLAKYSFIARYPGVINHPKKLKRNELMKFQNQLKRKYNIEFPDESDKESEKETNDVQVDEVERRNVIILGTPKKPKQTKTTTNDKNNDDIIPNDNNNKLQDSVLGTFSTENTAVTQNNVHEIDVSIIVIDDASVTNEKKVETKNKTKESINGFFKQANSMVVQVGSTVNSSIVEEPFDNDTSKTYVPESESDSESGLKETMNKIRKRATSPTSDDFEF